VGIRLAYTNEGGVRGGETVSLSRLGLLVHESENGDGGERVCSYLEDKPKGGISVGRLSHGGSLRVREIGDNPGR